MQAKEICVLGGSGFVGSAIVNKLAAAGYIVRVLTRRRESAKHLILLPNTKVLECNVLDYKALNNALRGADIVINLLGILHQTKGQSFSTIHQQLPSQLTKICADLHIPRLVQMSSLGASRNAPSQYLRSKGAGEEALNAARDVLNITIFKPSIIFGRGDKFINLFASLIKTLPFILLAKPNAKFQPIWVEDVATCVVNSLEKSATFGKTYELAGPKVYTFKALVQTIMQTLKTKRPIIGLGDGLSYAQAFFMELLPVKLMSRDNIRSMELDNMSASAFPAEFGILPTALESVIPQYLINDTQRGDYDRYRQSAARF
ncbi:MAG TPA: complex I NDUFA9 subunit family protein [Methylotenera sp.]|nr:complex I NDUFA9 subunit family protein [Methylotenera sp.]HPH05902.1 complex I NDUFA9 subunit family protein [Methylotenera sp.]HPN00683.1 complex I NDUFA9 subunit family protein [Methylotenera sp.]